MPCFDSHVISLAASINISIPLGSLEYEWAASQHAIDVIDGVFSHGGFVHQNSPTAELPGGSLIYH